MKNNSKFYNLRFGYVYSNGVTGTATYLHNYIFPYVLDIFSAEVWLKKKVIIFENKRLVSFKAKFSKKI
jgi:hypothetical protein